MSQAILRHIESKERHRYRVTLELNGITSQFNVDVTISGGVAAHEMIEHLQARWFGAVRPICRAILALDAGGPIDLPLAIDC